MTLNRGKLVIISLSALVLLLILGGLALRSTHETIIGFDQRGRFPIGTIPWQAYGGYWELTDGVMRDNSYERGAKLITGSRWSGNYRIEADVALVGDYGDAGLILRAKDLDEGVDSYSGLNVGLRTLDNSLFIGRADYAWDEYQRLAIPGNILTNHFYHLTVIAIGCDLGARVDLPSGKSVRAGISLRKCNRRGQVGLKSYQTPAAWKNFRVVPASRNDLDDLMAGVPFASSSLGNLHYYDPKIDENTPIEREALSRKVEVKTTPISDLQLSSSPTESQQAAVHGVVRLIKPVTYVEDTTGSVIILSHDQPALAIGDEVVVSGEVGRESGQLTLRNGHVQILWSDTPAPPLLITADEAATGSRAGRLAMMDGTLIRQRKGDDGSTILELASGGEVFSAIAAPATFSRPPILRPLSDVQVTGVITSDSTFAGAGAFAVLLPPSEDAVRVVREAPWWTTTRLIIALCAAVVAIVLLAFAYHKFKEQYLLQIMKERELLAHDLHDTVSQSFTGIGLQLSSASSYLASDSIAHAQVGRAQSMVRQSHEELRRSVTTLRHQIAAIGDLAQALKTTSHKMMGEAGVRIDCTVSGVAQRLPVPIADSFFRIGQEAIANALQHSQATLISISLTHENKFLRMRITDNGSGFVGVDGGSGHGIYGMKKRAEMIEARFEIINEPQGTTIFVEKHLSHSKGFFDSLLISHSQDS